MKTPEEMDEARDAIADALNTWCGPDHQLAQSLLAMAMALNFAEGKDNGMGVQTVLGDHRKYALDS